MGCLQIEEIKAHRSRFGAPRPQPMADRLLGIFGEQRLKLILSSLMFEISWPGPAEERCELRPAVGRAHIDNTNGFDARPRRLGIYEVGRFSRLDTAPELLFCRDQNTR